MSARLIENQWFADRFRDALKLRLHAAAGGLGTLRERENEAIREAVDAAAGNLSRAARSLGIGRSTLQRKLRAAKQPGQR